MDTSLKNSKAFLHNLSEIDCIAVEARVEAFATVAEYLDSTFQWSTFAWAFRLKFTWDTLAKGWSSRILTLDSIVQESSSFT